MNAYPCFIKDEFSTDSWREGSNPRQMIASLPRLSVVDPQRLYPGGLGHARTVMARGSMSVVAPML